MRSWIQTRYWNGVASDLPNEKKKENNCLVLKFSTNAKINGVSNKIEFWLIFRIIRWNGFLFFDKTHCSNDIFPKFCKNWHQETNFFGSLFESSCSVLCILFLAFFFLKKQRIFFSLSQDKKFALFFMRRKILFF